MVWTPRWAANERVARTLLGATAPLSVPQFPQVPMRGGGAARQVIVAPGDAGEQAREGASGGGGAGWRGKGRLRPPPPPPLPPSPCLGSRGPRLLPPPAPAPARSPPAPRLAPGPASDSAPPPPVPSSPGRRPGPLPRHEEAVGEEAFPGEGSGGGRRREGAGRSGRPGGRAGRRGRARGGGAGAAPAQSRSPRPRAGRAPGGLPSLRQAPPIAQAQTPSAPATPATTGEAPAAALGVERPRASVPPLVSVQPLAPAWLSPAPNSGAFHLPVLLKAPRRDLR